jgi:hypothetical protein
MKTSGKRHSRLLSIAGVLLAALTAGASPRAAAGKVDLSFGGYQFNASNKRNNTSSSLSGLGSYRLGYRYEFFDNLELDLGYSLLATKTLSGDLSFGVDLGMTYFPFTTAGDIRVNTAEVSGLYQSLWRPFVGVAFHQRNFQSTSSQYAGPGVKLGTEYQWRESVSFEAMLRYISLGGPNQSAAVQIEGLFGIVYQF